MIISHKYKFIFIRVPRTSSTSIQYSLGKICGNDDIVSEIVPLVPGHKPRNQNGIKQHMPAKMFKKLLAPKIEQHMPAKEIKRLLAPKQWNEYFKFCFERNPFAKMVSAYFYRSHDGRFKGDSFKQFCVDCSKGAQTFPKASEKYLIDGKIAVDFIGKFETIKKDFDYVCKKLNLPTSCQLPEKKFKQTSGKSHYSTYYDSTTKQIVSNNYSKELELFGYTFENKI